MKKSDRTKEKILKAGVKLWPNIRVEAVASELDINHSGIYYYFPSMIILRREIIKHALKIGESRVIAQLIAEKHPAIRSMPEEERKRHLNAI